MKLYILKAHEFAADNEAVDEAANLQVSLRGCDAVSDVQVMLICYQGAKSPQSSLFEAWSSAALSFLFGAGSRSTTGSSPLLEPICSKVGHTVRSEVVLCQPGHGVSAKWSLRWLE